MSKEHKDWTPGKGPTLLLDGHRGIFIPQAFGQIITADIQEEDRSVLQDGPDHEHYWDVWEDVLNTCTWTDADGVTWSLYQDNDLWAVPDTMTEEELDAFYGYTDAVRSKAQQE